MIGKIQGEEEVIKALAPGELSAVPYAEPSWLADGYRSPYYTPNHRQFQKAIRKFFVEVIYPEAVRCEESGRRISQEVFDKLRYAAYHVGIDAIMHAHWRHRGWSEINFLPMRLGPGNHLKGRLIMGGIVKPEEFDYFHEVRFLAVHWKNYWPFSVLQLIVNTELARFGTRGVVDGLLNGGVIAVPPILNYGSPELQAGVLPEVLSGKKFVALAISEALAGSDVAGLQTTAVKDGDHWVITGTKKYEVSFCWYITIIYEGNIDGLQMARSRIISVQDVKRRWHAPPYSYSHSLTVESLRLVSPWSSFLVERVWKQTQSRLRTPLWQVQPTSHSTKFACR